MREYISKYGYEKTCLVMVFIIVLASLLVSGMVYCVVAALGYAISLRWTLLFSALVPCLTAPFIVFPLVRLLRHMHALEIQLREMATYDSLTKVLNRRAFLEGAQLLLKQRTHEPPEQGSVIMIIDLDHFKRVNDRFGHLCGDEVLKSFGEVVQSILRKGDLIGRLGGEEFGVYLPNVTLENARGFAERLRSRIEETGTHLENCVVAYTISIGASSLHQEDNLLESLNQADQALYFAKNNGRNRVVFWEEIRHKINLYEAFFEDGTRLSKTT